jgi:hypothetical protein
MTRSNEHGLYQPKTATADLIVIPPAGIRRMSRPERPAGVGAPAVAVSRRSARSYGHAASAGHSLRPSYRLYDAEPGELVGTDDDMGFTPV